MSDQSALKSFAILNDLEFPILIRETNPKNYTYNFRVTECNCNKLGYSKMK